MANPFFHFKQFTLRQDRCSLKLSTEAALFGAWVADSLRSSIQEGDSGLDIGSGTGLLSLQLAQELPLQMTALEIDASAAAQAAENAVSSPWPGRIRVLQADALEYSPAAAFRLIISNPPFFSGDLLPADNSKRLSKHEGDMDLNWLLRQPVEWLNENGFLALLLPAKRARQAEELAAGVPLQLLRKAWIRQTENHDAFRIFLLFQKMTGAGESVQAVEESLPAVKEPLPATREPLPAEETILLREGGFYSDRFAQLMQPFYRPEYHLRNMK